MYEKPLNLPDPEGPIRFDRETGTAQEIDQYFFLLASYQKESITIDDSEIVHIYSVEHIDNGHSTRVVAGDSEGRKHMYTYATGTDGHVRHHILDNPPATQ